MHVSVLTNSEDVRRVFYDSDQHIKATNNNSGWLMGQLLGNCVGLINGLAWQHVRELTAVPFSHKHVVSSLSLVDQMTRKHLAQLQVDGRLKQGRLDPIEDLRFLPFWVVAQILYGELSAELTMELQVIIVIREAIWGRMLQGGATRYAWSRYLPTRINRDLSVFKEKWASFNSKVYLNCQSMDKTPPVVGMYSAVEKGTICLDQLLQTLDEMLFANLDVTMGGLSWNLLFLADNPTIQGELREEIRVTSKTHDPASREGYIRSSSTLLAFCILESARLRPLAAYSVPQSAPTARTVAGYTVPAGTNFVVDAYKLSMSSPYWGSDSASYHPTRFAGKSVLEMRYHYWRFGFGPRQCMGKYIADAIIRMVLLHLVEHFELAFDKDTRWERNAVNWITHPKTTITCRRL
jgi:cytochrome P450